MREHLELVEEDARAACDRGQGFRTDLGGDAEEVAHRVTHAIEERAASDEGRAPFDEVFVVGFSNGAYYAGSLALRGKLDVAGYAVFGMIMLSVTKPVTLMQYATVIFNFALGFSCWHSLVVNLVLLPPKLPPQLRKRNVRSSLPPKHNPHRIWIPPVR